MKKLLALIISMMVLIGIALPTAVQAGAICPSLPSGTVTTIWETNHWAAGSYFWITLNEADPLSGKYDGWCVDIHGGTPTLNTAMGSILICSYSPAATNLVDKPGNLDLVNWILNYDFRGRDAGGGLVYSWADVQVAFWRLLENTTPGYYGGLPDWTGWTEEKVAQIITNATANGNNFEPTSGELCAVFVVPPINPLTGLPYQISLIAIMKTGDGHGEGLTPGFWKNNADKFNHAAWVHYLPTNDYSDIFGIVEQTLAANGKAKYTNPTLRQALDANGSGINLLARSAVAALLNASNPDIDYPMTQQQIVASVQAAIAAGTKAINNLGEQLDLYNNFGASIDQHWTK